jgi:hypothetical protein
MIHDDDDALPHSDVCLLRGCDAVLGGPGMERTLSLPAADYDREGSSSVACPASFCLLRPLPGTSSVAEVSYDDISYQLVADSNFTFTRKRRLSCANIKIRVDTTGTTTSYPEAWESSIKKRLTTYISFQSLLQTLSSWLECAASHTGFYCPSLQLRAENRVSASPGEHSSSDEWPVGC